MGFNEGKSGNTGLIFFIVVVLVAGVFIFSVRQENNASNPLDGLFASTSDGNSLGYYNAAEKKENATLIEAYFCPEDACADKLIRKIDSAKSSVFVAIYSLTLDGISDSLIRAKKRGVEVKVIFDSDQSKNDASDDERMGNEGISVAYRNGSGYMHNKFTIIDLNIVATGSFNYSNNADTRNEENLVFIESSGLAESFKQNFDSIWAKSNAN
jgi:phosphatidylserine/phosphatidylglycerophosphate/cardiolipin synthase-like enzyme